jgi:alpha-glucosidase
MKTRTFLLQHLPMDILRISVLFVSLSLLSIGSAWAQMPNPIADQAIQGFNNAFIHQAGGLTFYKTALNNTEKDYFWQQALDIQTTQDAYDRTHDNQYKVLTAKLLDAFLAQNSDAGTAGGWTWNEYNDDLIWGVQAFMRGYEITGDIRYLNQAKYGFNLTYFHAENGGNWGWDNMFGGGIWWDKSKTNKNALSNSPTIVAACQLYKATGDVMYLNKAKEIYDWTRSHLWDPTTGGVYSEVLANGITNKTQLIFNSGAFGGAANWLYQMTGNKEYFNDARFTFDRVITHMTNGGKLASGQRNGTDLAEYIRHLGEFANQNNLWGTYYVFLKTSADAAWNMRRTDLNITWNDFTKPTPADNVTGVNECNSGTVIQQIVPVPQALPGSIEAEYYHRMKGIVIEDLNGGGGKFAGRFDNGDWVEYVVHIAEPGKYKFDFRVSASSASQMTLYQNGENLAAVNLPNTGGAQSWQTVSTTVNIKQAGIQTIRLTSAGSAWNIDRFTMTLAETLLPGLIQAESYVAMSGVGTQATTDVNGGDNVGFIDAGDWMEYNVNIPTTGKYILSYRFAAQSVGSVALQINGKTLNISTVPNTGNWQNWETVIAGVVLKAGQQTIRLLNSSGVWNINWFSLVLDSTTPPSSTGLVTIYSDCNFTGGSVGLDLGSYSSVQLNALGFFDDDISAIKVTEGNQVVLFEGDNFTGNSFSIVANSACLASSNWDDKVSSLKILPLSRSFMAGDNIAAFYPNNFDSLGTLPSMSFKNNIQWMGNVPESWSVVPTFRVENGKNIVTIPYTGDVDFYGNGEVTGPLRRNGTQVTLWNSEAPNYAVDNGTRLYQSHPWIMGVRSNGTAFGIIADHTWKQSFTISNPITITSDGPGFRVIVIERNNPEELVKALGELTGKIELPALWTLGYQQSRFTYYPASTVANIANEFRRRKIPCDVIWMDIGYMDQYKVFTFDPGGFADPKGLNDYLHSKDFKAVYMIDPGVKTEPGYFVYDQGKAGNHWVQKHDGTEYHGQVWPPIVSFPDFTRPETRTWWSSLYGDFMAQGIDGVWNDMNEPSVFDTPNKTMPENNLHRGGGDLPAATHARYHNVYGYLMVKASREGIALANPGKRPFVLSRSNFLGGQRYAANWTGDNLSTWAHLKLSVPMSITLGLSGQPISGADIGGFNGSCTGDLLGHWIALGVYYPFSRNHTTSGSAPQEPWAYEPEIERVSRTAINRRYRLLPYMYTLLRETSQTGLPFMRPAFFADHADPGLRDEQEAFLVGKDLLVVPRWAVNPSLPQGDWDKVRFENTEDRYQASVFIRPGAVVPLGNVIQSTAEYKSDSITLLLNPLESGLATGQLYHDDGDGYGYQTNNYAVHEFLVSKHHEDSLKVVIHQIEGSKDVSRVYRVGYVTDSSIVYSPWSDRAVRYIAFLRDETSAIDLSHVNSMYISGSFNTGFMPMEHIDEKKWKIDSIRFQSGTTYTLKFSQRKDESIGIRWGASAGLSGTVSAITDPLDGVTFSVPSSDYYSVAFDQSTLRYVIQKTPSINSLAIVGDATAPRNFDMLGLPMSQSIEDLNVFTWIGSLQTGDSNTEGKFKFHSGKNGPCDDVWIYASVQDQSLSATSLVIANGCSVPDNKWKVQPGQNGNYKITVNVLTKKITIQKLLSTLSIVGDATVIGWNTIGLSMEQAPDRPNLFTWTGKLTAASGTREGRFKFHSGTNGFCDDIWLYAATPDQSLSATSYVMANGCSAPDNKWKVKPGETGDYKITIDVDAKTIHILGTSDGGPVTGVDAASEVSVQVFPNPARESVTIRITGLAIPSSKKISLHDLRGTKLIEFQHSREGDIQLPMSQFPGGIYLLRVETAGGVFVKKIAK